MFTGIVEETGIVRKIVRRPSAIRLAIEARRSARGVRTGDSVAVNGCCLTVVGRKSCSTKPLLQFDLLQETWKRTNLQFARPGTLVNLERALPASGRISGHFVTGHIDGLGRVVNWRRVGDDYKLDVAAPASLLRYIVFKGSIAVDGISLTVASVSRRGFSVWIIPHTYEVTNLHQQTKGSRVNLETDLLAKYLEKLIPNNIEHPKKSTPVDV